MRTSGSRASALARAVGPGYNAAMRTHILIVVMLTLAACSQQPSNSGDSSKTPSPRANTPPTGAGAASATPVVEQVPDAYLGVWDGIKASCDSNSDMRVEIGKQQVTFYESSGQVKQVAQQGPGTVELTLAMDGEGEQWTQKMRFSLSPDGQHLSASPVTADQPAITNQLKRCA